MKITDVILKESEESDELVAEFLGYIDQKNYWEAFNNLIGAYDTNADCLQSWWASFDEMKPEIMKALLYVIKNEPDLPVDAIIADMYADLKWPELLTIQKAMQHNKQPVAEESDADPMIGYVQDMYSDLKSGFAGMTVLQLRDYIYDTGSAENLANSIKQIQPELPALINQHKTDIVKNMLEIIKKDFDYAGKAVLPVLEVLHHLGIHWPESDRIAAALTQGKAKNPVGESTDEIIDEVTQNPTVWDNFLSSSTAKNVVMGFEAEMCVKGLASNAAHTINPKDDMFIPNLRSKAGKQKFIDFWTQNDTDNLRIIRSYGFPTLIQIIEDASFDKMSELLKLRQLKWPFPTKGLTMTTLGQQFTDATGYKVIGGGMGSTASSSAFAMVSDVSIDPREGDGGVELVSYPMPLPEAMAALNKTFEWAKSGNIAYTNTSTGFHINVSLAGKKLSDVDQLKLLLLMGDNAILAEFGRKTNTYCFSMLKKLQDVTKAAATGNDRHLDKYDDWGQISIGNIEPYFQKILPQMRSQTWAGLKKIANDIMKQVHFNDKFVTVNLHDDYIEFRGAGGNWLNRWDDIYYTVLRVSHAYTLAADPQAGQQDYLKKLYKVMTTYNQGNDQLKLWTDYTMGTVKLDQIKKILAKKHAPARKAAAKLVKKVTPVAAVKAPAVAESDDDNNMGREQLQRMAANHIISAIQNKRWMSLLDTSQTIEQQQWSLDSRYRFPEKLAQYKLDIVKTILQAVKDPRWFNPDLLVAVKGLKRTGVNWPELDTIISGLQHGKEKIGESAELIPAAEILKYVKQIHPEGEFNIDHVITDHPFWQEADVPVSSLHIFDPEKDDIYDPYNRVQDTDLYHVDRLIPNIAAILQKKPLVIDDAGYILDGNHRALAAEKAGLQTVPVWQPVKGQQGVAEDLTATDIAQYVQFIDKKLSDNLRNLFLWVIEINAERRMSDPEFRSQVLAVFDKRKPEILHYMLRYIKHSDADNIKWLTPAMIKMGIDWPELKTIDQALNAKKPDRAVTENDDRYNDARKQKSEHDARLVSSALEKIRKHITANNAPTVREITSFWDTIYDINVFSGYRMDILQPILEHHKKTIMYMMLYILKHHDMDDPMDEIFTSLRHARIDWPELKTIQQALAQGKKTKSVTENDYRFSNYHKEQARSVADEINSWLESLSRNIKAGSKIPNQEIDSFRDVIYAIRNFSYYRLNMLQPVLEQHKKTIIYMILYILKYHSNNLKESEHILSALKYAKINWPELKSIQQALAQGSKTESVSEADDYGKFKTISDMIARDFAEHPVRGFYMMLYWLDETKLTVADMPEIKPLVDKVKPDVIRALLLSIKHDDQGVNISNALRILDRMQNCGVNWPEIDKIRQGLQHGRNTESVTENKYKQAEAEQYASLISSKLEQASKLQGNANYDSHMMYFLEAMVKVSQIGPGYGQILTPILEHYKPVIIRYLLLLLKQNKLSAVENILEIVFNIHIQWSELETIKKALAHGKKQTTEAKDYSKDPFDKWTERFANDLENKVYWHFAMVLEELAKHMNVGTMRVSEPQWQRAAVQLDLNAHKREIVHSILKNLKDSIVMNTSSNWLLKSMIAQKLILNKLGADWPELDTIVAGVSNNQVNN